VSWDDVQGFLSQINERVLGLDLRLPAEAEWEYACRAGTTTAFAFGDDLTHDMANFGGDKRETVPVRSYRPNAWGLYQMHGNVDEWCADCYFGYYSGETLVDPKCPEHGSDRVYRGGSWFFVAQNCRSAYRVVWCDPGIRHDILGFRLCRGPE